MTTGSGQGPLPGFPGLVGPDGRPLRHWRGRDGTGRSDESYRKHDRLREFACRSVAIQSCKPYARGRGVVIDTHAGDGEGVALPQPDMFFPDLARSLPTARLALELGTAYGLDVFLAEKRKEVRARLLAVVALYPAARTTIVGDWAELPGAVAAGGYRWGLVINDPNGPATQGVPVLGDLVRIIPHLDLALTLNVGAIKRHFGVRPDGVPGRAEPPGVAGCRATREKYVWMLEPGRWWRWLRKRYLFRTRVANQSEAFRASVMLWSDYRFPGRFRRGAYEAVDLFDLVPPEER